MGGKGDLQPPTTNGGEWEKFAIVFELITISILHHTNGLHMNVIVRLLSSFSVVHFDGWFISILPLVSAARYKKQNKTNSLQKSIYQKSSCKEGSVDQSSLSENRSKINTGWKL